MKHVTKRVLAMLLCVIMCVSLLPVSAFAVYDYSITYVLNGGTNDSSNPTGYNAGEGVALLPATRTGYVFGGWYDNPELSGNPCVGLVPTATGDKEFYAKWTGIDYTVAFDANGGEGTMTEQSFTYGDASQSLSACTFTRTGYKFLGWSKSKTATAASFSDKMASPDVTGEADITVTLYAVWQPVSYRVEYDANEGDGGMMPVRMVEYDEGASFSACAYTKTGYNFVNWNTMADGSGTSYDAGGTMPNLTSVDGKTVILYAQWALADYSITYELDGGTNSDKNPEGYTYGDHFSFEPAEKEGYLFNGWYSDSALSTAVTGIKTDDTGDKTVYAGYDAVEYYVTFDGNGADGGLDGMPAVLTFKYDKLSPLPANTYTKTGSDFAGWNTAADGSGDSYADHSAVKNITSQGGLEVTLYAQWTLKTGGVFYVLNGGTNSSLNPATVAYGETVELKGATKDGYTFGGWFDSSDFKGIRYAKVSYDNAASGLTLYARWLPNTYYIKFSGNGATSGSMSKITAIYDNNVTLTANAFKRTGYVFDGWNTAIDGSGTDYADKASGKLNLTDIDAATVTLYAKWSLKNYSITYNLNGGTNSVKNPASYNIEDNTIVLEEPTRTGYKFAGWYTDAKFTTKVTKIPGGSHADKVFYAKWVGNTSYVTFDRNDVDVSGAYLASKPTGKMANEKFTYGADVKNLTANAFVCSGYTFTGWNTKKDGSGTAYANKQAVKNLTTDHDPNCENPLVLYAQWKENSYTVTFDKNGGTGTMADIALKYSDEFVLPACSYTRTGYTFAGWTRTVGSKTVTYTVDGTTKYSGLTKTNGATIVFKAKWTANKYKVQFVENAPAGETVTGSMLLENFTYGTAKALTANAFKCTGYTFVSWNTAADGSGTSYANKELVKHLVAANGATIKLYAQWKLKEYTITYKLNGGTNDASNPASYNKLTPTFTIADPVRPGYEFMGWYSNSTLTKAVNTTILQGSTTNRTFYAKWRALKIHVTFDSNGTTPYDMATQTFTFGTSKVMRANSFKRSGFTFAGWSLVPNPGSSDKLYLNRATVTKAIMTEFITDASSYYDAATDRYEVTLYAVWKLKST